MKTPGNWTLEGFFAGRPEAFGLYTCVSRYLETLGPLQTEVMKTQISFASINKFAWVWLPQTWIRKRTETSLTLTFVLDREVIDPRIESRVEPRPGHWTYHLILNRAEELDEQVKVWLQEAYALGLKGKRR